jgi:hypothetical protein
VLNGPAVILDAGVCIGWWAAGRSSSPKPSAHIVRGIHKLLVCSVPVARSSRRCRCGPMERKSLSASGEEWTNDQLEAKNRKEDQEPAPKGCGAYALADRCSDPHGQQCGKDRECGQGNIPDMESSATRQARRKRNCGDRERQSQCLDKVIFGKAYGLEIGNGGTRENPGAGHAAARRANRYPAAGTGSRADTGRAVADSAGLTAGSAAGVRYAPPEADIPSLFSASLLLAEN